MALTKPKAEQIEFTPSGGLSATNLQAALNELDSDKTNTANLTAPSGSSLVGYDTGTVQDVLDAVTGPNGAASVGYTPAWIDAAQISQKIVNDELEVSPDHFTGNDRQRIEKAIAVAIATRKAVAFARMFDITGLGEISITKPFSPRWYLRLKGLGGGIKKTDVGYVFTSAVTDTMDFKVQNMRFESTPGAGAILWNANKIVRVYSSNNQYIGWDTIAEANTRWMQQYELVDEHVSGGRGWLVSFRENWGCKFVRINIEDRNYNRDVTIDIASSTLNVSNHGMPNGFVVYLTTTGTVPTGLTPAGTTNAGKYFVVSPTTNTFQLSATSGGSAITLSGTQSGTHRVYYGDGHGIGNSEDLNQLANRNMVVSDCVYENNAGTFLRLCGSFATTISDNYTEAVRGEHIDLQSFQSYVHNGLKISGNQFQEANPAKYPILWGKISAQNISGLGGAVSECNVSSGNLHNLISANSGYIFSVGDYSALMLVGGSGNSKYLIRGGQYRYATNADGSTSFEHGTTRKLASSKSVTIAAGSLATATIPFAVGVINTSDIVSVTTTNAFNLEVLATQVAFDGSSVVVWVRNLDATNPITRTIYCSVLQLAI